MTRRGLIGAGAMVVALASVGPTPVAAASVGTFALDATGFTCTSNCSSCSACLNHAANKLFRTNAAADIGRAHPGCDCAVGAGQSLSQGVLDAMFLSSDSADRRDPATAALLSAELEQHSVPMITGLVPATVLAAGAGGILWVAHRRRLITPES